MKLSRSPYIIEVDDATQTGSKIELFLAADVGTINPTYTLSKLIPASTTQKLFTIFRLMFVSIILLQRGKMQQAWLMA